mmetsp:Transcript_20254/g.36116  ORF Transcript_20254/g.36116 Transcript_20254/m.36116 type:complete len:202 (-) Transcript_20254:1740-2345(-)
MQLGPGEAAGAQALGEAAEAQAPGVAKGACGCSPSTSGATEATSATISKPTLFASVSGGRLRLLCCPRNQGGGLLSSGDAEPGENCKRRREATERGPANSPTLLDCLLAAVAGVPVPGDLRLVDRAGGTGGEIGGAPVESTDIAWLREAGDSNCDRRSSFSCSLPPRAAAKAKRHRPATLRSPWLRSNNDGATTAITSFAS